MASLARPALSAFAQDVGEGLSSNPKRLSARYFYDDLGSALFEAITYLPEYGLTRADERLLERHSREIAARAHAVETVCELGSGSGRKTRHVLEAFEKAVVYRPIDVSRAALEACEKALSDVADVRPVCADWREGLQQVARIRARGPLLVLFLGSSIGNIDRSELPAFLREIRSALKPGDYFLVGFDLVKGVERMLEAYDDPTGVTAAFNRNLLGRINRELHGNFDLRGFEHEARWNPIARRMEMHLVSSCPQRVWIGALDREVSFQAGETIWTESSNKFDEAELADLGASARFVPVATWIDEEWPFAEALWRAE